MTDISEKGSDFVRDLGDAARSHVQACIPLCLRRADGVKDHVDHAALSRTKCRAGASREWAGLDAEACRTASSSHVFYR